jgi:hypothetical protein
MSSATSESKSSVNKIMTIQRLVDSNKVERTKIKLELLINLII